MKKTSLVITVVFISLFFLLSINPIVRAAVYEVITLPASYSDIIPNRQSIHHKEANKFVVSYVSVTDGKLVSHIFKESDGTLEAVVNITDAHAHAHQARYFCQLDGDDHSHLAYRHDIISAHVCMP